MWIFAFWTIGAMLSAVGIVIDMHRLGVTRVGVPAASWILTSAVIGPAALVFYFIKRSAVHRRLLDAVWILVGNESRPAAVRYARLQALRQLGLVSPAIYESCRRALRQGIGTKQ